MVQPVPNYPAVPLKNDITLDMGDYQIDIKDAYITEITETISESGYTEMVVQFQIPTTTVTGQAGYSISTKKLQVPKVNKREKKKAIKKKAIKKKVIKKKTVTQEEMSETFKDIEHVWI